MTVVFSSHSEVAHSWATQSQPFGRSPTPSGSFNWRGGDSSADGPRVRYVGRMFYSYETPVARLEPSHNGAGLVLLQVPNEWGPATGSHLKLAAGAVSHLIGADEHGRGGRSFTVPHVGGYPDGVSRWQDRLTGRDKAEWAADMPPPSAVDHIGNAEWLREQYRSAAARFRSQRGEPSGGYYDREAGDYGEWVRLEGLEAVKSSLRGLWSVAADYCELFGPIPATTAPSGFPGDLEAVDSEAAAIMAERDERAARALARLTPKEIARREAAKAERSAKAERLKALRFADRETKLEAWRDGLNVRTYDLPRHPTGAAYIRATGVKRDKAGAICGGTLETSQGARVPLREAVRVFRFLKCVRESGEGWRPSGLRQIRVGAFIVNHIEPDGSFRAGCHSFAWPEILRLAEALGVAFLSCDESAVAGAEAA